MELVEDRSTVADLGYYASKNHDEPAVVARIDRDAPAAAAGLRIGDVIVSDVSARPDEPVTVRIRRDGEIREIGFRAGHKEVPTYRIRDLPGADARQRAIRESFAAGK
jgi:S1-C subfamily serine protease